MEENKCTDCMNNTVNGCALEKEPKTCGMELPLPLMMEVGLI